jgi:hypothetical protein
MVLGCSERAERRFEEIGAAAPIVLSMTVPLLWLWPDRSLVKVDGA